jgi:hypothetical protein
MRYAGDGIDSAQALGYAKGYLFGTGEQMKKSGRFLNGLFMAGWDILFQDSGFLDGLTHVLGSIPHEDFLSLLPDLRLAFSVFTPLQIDRIAKEVARLLGVEETAAQSEAVPEQLLALGRQLDRYAAAKGGIVHE